MNEAMPTWSSAMHGTLGEIRYIKGGHCQRTFVPLPATQNVLATTLAQAGLAAQMGYDVYFGLNPRLRARGNNDAVYCYTAFFVDIDAGKGHCSADLVRLLPPSAIVHSGTGWHLYWFLRMPVLVRDGLEVARKLCILAGSDPVWAPAQTPRLPGTLNWKTPQLPHPVQLIARQDGGYFFPDIGRVVHGLLPNALPEPAAPVRARVPTSRLPAERFIPMLPTKLQRLYRAYDTPNSWVDRSRADAALARWAVEQNWTDSQIAQLLCAPKCAKMIERLRCAGTAAAQHYLSSTIGWARRSVDRERAVSA